MLPFFYFFSSYQWCVEWIFFCFGLPLSVESSERRGSTSNLVNSFHSYYYWGEITLFSRGIGKFPLIGLFSLDGTVLTQTLSSGAPFRALFQPELNQFQAAFDDAVAEAVEAVGAGVAVLVVVYAGEVLHTTGEWILTDSTFSGEQLQMWLDSEAASVSKIS